MIDPTFKYKVLVNFQRIVTHYFEREDIGVSLSKTEYYESLPSPVPNGLFYTCNFIPIEKAIYGLKGDIYKPYI